MIINIARKELKSLFASPMGWIILALLQFVFGTFFLMGIDQYFQTMSGIIRPEERLGVTEFIGRNVFTIASMVMLFAVPLLSMRLISEERRQQTLTFLFSAPLSLTEIVRWQEENFWMVGPQLAGSLFDFGRRQNNVRATRAAFLFAQTN